MDSCVECWANCEEQAKGKNKKKKRKSRVVINANEHVSYTGQNVHPITHVILFSLALCTCE